MIFAEMEYPEQYQDLHQELDRYLRDRFQRVESGLQCDSWFWIFAGDQKVAVDTFSSRKHQVKASSSGPLVTQVIAALQGAYKVNIYPVPEIEPHEGS